MTFLQSPISSWTCSCFFLNMFFLNLFFFFQENLIHSILWLLSRGLPNLCLSFRSFLSSEYVQLTIEILHKEFPSLFLFFGILFQCMTSPSIRKQKSENSEPFLKICLTHSLTVNEQILPDVWYAHVGLLDLVWFFSHWPLNCLRAKQFHFFHIFYCLAEDLAYDGCLIKSWWNKGVIEVEEVYLLL